MLRVGHSRDFGQQPFFCDTLPQVATALISRGATLLRMSLSEDLLVGLSLPVYFTLSERVTLLKDHVEQYQLEARWCQYALILILALATKLHMSDLTSSNIAINVLGAVPTRPRICLFDLADWDWVSTPTHPAKHSWKTFTTLLKHCCADAEQVLCKVNRQQTVEENRACLLEDLPPHYGKLLELQDVVKKQGNGYKLHLRLRVQTQAICLTLAVVRHSRKHTSRVSKE